MEERSDSEFMKAFDALSFLLYYDDRSSIIRRFKELAELVDKHSIKEIDKLTERIKELEEWVEVLRNSESLHDRFKRTGKL